ncbi:MAG: HAMP domain-containing sensor histidine kinase [Oscillospiraceae bacterium]
MSFERLKTFSQKAISKFNHQSLFAKYFSMFIVVIFICFLLLGTTLSFFVSTYWTDQKSNLLKENAKNVANTTSQALSSSMMVTNPTETMIIICNNLATISHAIDADIFVTDPNGKVILCSELMRSDFTMNDDGNCKIHGDYKIPQKTIDEAKRGGLFEQSQLGETFKTKQLIAAQPVVVGGNVTAIVFAIQPAASGARAFVFDIFRMFLFSSILALAIGFVAIYFFTISLIKPLKAMSKATRVYAMGDFSERIPVRGSDELSELAEAFNSMAYNLSLLESSRRSFIANVSHELKTPMTTIGGFIDGILDGTIPPEKQNYYLDIVSTETKRLARLVTAMLNMSKIEAGELKLKPKRFDICSDIFNIMLSFEQIIEKKHINIEGLDALEPTFVNADQDMIHQVIYNLVDNAVKFTQDGSIIVFIEKKANSTIIKIRNTGKGISSEELARVFERFYKVDKSRSFDVKGAGLGLYIVKTIVEMHGGTIKADSVENEYSEFSFSLPN